MATSGTKATCGSTRSRSTTLWFSADDDGLLGIRPKK
jgi:hypothetical protein